MLADPASNPQAPALTTLTDNRKSSKDMHQIYSQSLSRASRSHATGGAANGKSSKEGSRHLVTKKSQNTQRIDRTMLNNAMAINQSINSTVQYRGDSNLNTNSKQQQQYFPVKKGAHGYWTKQGLYVESGMYS